MASPYILPFRQRVSGVSGPEFPIESGRDLTNGASSAGTVEEQKKSAGNPADFLNGLESYRFLVRRNAFSSGEIR